MATVGISLAFYTNICKDMLELRGLNSFQRGKWVLHTELLLRKLMEQMQFGLFARNEVNWDIK